MSLVPPRIIPPPLVEPASDAFPLYYQSPYIPPLPQERQHGGQSNEALLILMKQIETEIAERQLQPEYEECLMEYPNA